MRLVIKSRVRPVGSISPDGRRKKMPDGTWGPNPDYKPKKRRRKKRKVKATVKVGVYYDPREDWQKNGVKSKVFKDWFGDWENDPEHVSKVTTKTGEPEKQYNTGPVAPIKMYHGTGKGGFSEFMRTGNSGKLLYGSGFYFTADKEVAKTYQRENKVETFDFETVFTEDELKTLYKTAKDTLHFSAQKFLPDPLKSEKDKTTFLQTLGYMYAHKEYDDYTQFGKAMRDLFHKMRSDKLKVKVTDESQLFEVYLRIKKPFDIDKDRLPGSWIGLAPEKTYEYLEAVKQMHWKKFHKPIGIIDEKLSEYKDKIQAELKKHGYDGITHIGGMKVGVGLPKHRVWIAFDANDIKSTDNEGTFTESPNIYKSRRMPIGTVSHGRKKVAEGKWVPVHQDKHIRKTEGKAVLEKYLLQNEDRPKEPPLPGKVFRVMSKDEWNKIKAGGESGQFWSSDPTDYGHFAVRDNSVIVVAESKGNKKYKGIWHEGDDLSKRHYHNLDVKTKDDVVEAYQFIGPDKYRGKFVDVMKSMKLLVPLQKHKKAMVGEIRMWADGREMMKQKDGSWKIISKPRQKQDKAKVAKKRYEMAIGKRTSLGVLRFDYDASVDKSPTGYVIGGLLEYQYGIKDFDDLNEYVRTHSRDDLSKIFRTIKDGIDATNVPVGEKRYHVDMFGKTLLKLKRLHDPDKVKLTVPVETKKGTTRYVYKKGTNSVPARALKEARSMTAGWKSGKRLPTTEMLQGMVKNKTAKITGTIDPKLKWEATQLRKDTIVPFRAEEKGIKVKLRQFVKEKGKKRGYVKVTAEVIVPYAYAKDYLEKHIKSTRTRNELVGQLVRSKGYRRVVLREKVE